MARLSPSIVNLELTNRCVLECVFCDHAALKKTMQIGDMSEELLAGILESLRNTPIYELGVVGLGEPLANKSLERHMNIISQYRDGFTRISFNSNAVLLDEEKALLIADSPVTLLTFSLNATNRESYRLLMGRDMFDSVVRNIKAFLHLIKQKGKSEIKVSIQYMLSNLNDEDEIKRLFGDYESMGVILYGRPVFNKPALESRGKGMINVNQVDNSHRYPCWSMYSRTYVDIEGNVYPCTVGNDSYRAGSSLHIGNVKEKSLMDIFNGENINSARKISEKGGIPFHECEQCTAWGLLPNNFSFQAGRWIFIQEGKIRRKAFDRED